MSFFKTLLPNFIKIVVLQNFIYHTDSRLLKKNQLTGGKVGNSMLLSLYILCNVKINKELELASIRIHVSTNIRINIGKELCNIKQKISV